MVPDTNQTKEDSRDTVTDLRENEGWCTRSTDGQSGETDSQSNLILPLVTDGSSDRNKDRLSSTHGLEQDSSLYSEDTPVTQTTDPSLVLPGYSLVDSNPVTLLNQQSMYQAAETEGLLAQTGKITDDLGYGGFKLEDLDDPKRFSDDVKFNKTEKVSMEKSQVKNKEDLFNMLRTEDGDFSDTNVKVNTNQLNFTVETIDASDLLRAESVEVPVKREGSKAFLEPDDTLSDLSNEPLSSMMPQTDFTGKHGVILSDKTGFKNSQPFQEAATNFFPDATKTNPLRSLEGPSEKLLTADWEDSVRRETHDVIQGDNKAQTTLSNSILDDVTNFSFNTLGLHLVEPCPELKENMAKRSPVENILTSPLVNEPDLVTPVQIKPTTQNNRADLPSLYLHNSQFPNEKTNSPDKEMVSGTGEEDVVAIDNYIDSSNREKRENVGISLTTHQRKAAQTDIETTNLSASGCPSSLGYSLSTQVLQDEPARPLNAILELFPKEGVHLLAPQTDLEPPFDGSESFPGSESTVFEESKWTDSVNDSRKVLAVQTKNEVSQNQSRNDMCLNPEHQSQSCDINSRLQSFFLSDVERHNLKPDFTVGEPSKVQPTQIACAVTVEEMKVEKDETDPESRFTESEQVTLYTLSQQEKASFEDTPCVTSEEWSCPEEAPKDKILTLRLPDHHVEGTSAFAAVSHEMDKTVENISNEEIRKAPLKDTPCQTSEKPPCSAKVRTSKQPNLLVTCTPDSTAIANEMDETTLDASSDKKLNASSKDTLSLTSEKLFCLEEMLKDETLSYKLSDHPVARVPDISSSGNEEVKTFLKTSSDADTAGLDHGKSLPSLDFNACYVMKDENQVPGSKIKHPLEIFGLSVGTHETDSEVTETENNQLQTPADTRIPMEMSSNDDVIHVDGSTTIKANPPLQEKEVPASFLALESEVSEIFIATIPDKNFQSQKETSGALSSRGNGQNASPVTADHPGGQTKVCAKNKKSLQNDAIDSFSSSDLRVQSDNDQLQTATLSATDLHSKALIENSELPNVQQFPGNDTARMSSQPVQHKDFQRDESTSSSVIENRQNLHHTEVSRTMIGDPVPKSVLVEQTQPTEAKSTLQIESKINIADYPTDGWSVNLGSTKIIYPQDNADQKEGFQISKMDDKTAVLSQRKTQDLELLTPSSEILECSHAHSVNSQKSEEVHNNLLHNTPKEIHPLEKHPEGRLHIRPDEGEEYNTQKQRSINTSDVAEITEDKVISMGSVESGEALLVENDDQPQMRPLLDATYGNNSLGVQNSTPIQQADLGKEPQISIGQPDQLVLEVENSNSQHGKICERLPTALPPAGPKEAEVMSETPGLLHGEKEGNIMKSSLLNDGSLSDSINLTAAEESIRKAEVALQGSDLCVKGVESVLKETVMDLKQKDTGVLSDAPCFVIKETEIVSDEPLSTENEMHHASQQIRIPPDDLTNSAMPVTPIEISSTDEEVNVQVVAEKCGFSITEAELEKQSKPEPTELLTSRKEPPTEDRLISSFQSDPTAALDVSRPVSEPFGDSCQAEAVPSSPVIRSPTFTPTDSYSFTQKLRSVLHSERTSAKKPMSPTSPEPLVLPSGPRPYPGEAASERPA